ncbi:MAG: hypothetical protein R3F60_16135 [bacterium]
MIPAPAPLEWAAVGEGAVVVATPTRSWLHHPTNLSDPFRFSMTCPGTTATTERLLDGAIAAGLRAGARGGTPAPPLTLTRWVGRLVSYYHLTHSTPGLLVETARRFTAAGRPALAAWATEKAHEEHAHDRLALRDLDELGYDAGITAVRPPTAGAMVDWFRAATEVEPLPLGVVAYAHTVERLALTQDAAAIAAVRAVLPPGSRAIRCLRVHSALGSDVSHVRDNVLLVSSLPATERAAIALACWQVAALFSATPDEGHQNDAALAALFRPWRRSHGGQDG